MIEGCPRSGGVNVRLKRFARAIHGGMGSTIIPYEDGPLIVRGDFDLRTPDGTPIEAGRATIALCRCGRSAIKPFCDGTHKAVNFKAGVNRETPPRP
jgi:CDGSH-type Zn-finger protein